MSSSTKITLSLQAMPRLHQMLRVFVFAAFCFLPQLVKGQCTNYTISTDGNATNAAQASWNLVNQAGVTVLSGGGANQVFNVCLPDGCYTLEMFDSAANGWGNTDWIIQDLTGNFDFDTNLADGSLGTTQFILGSGICGAVDPCAPLTTYIIEVTAGTDPADVSWELTDPLGVVVASGGAPFLQEVCLDDLCYTLNMYDASGDGWDNDTWFLYNPDQSYFVGLELNDAGFASQLIPVGNSVCSTIDPCLPLTSYTITVTGGIDQADVYWELYDQFGVVQAAGFAPDFQTLCLDGGCYSLILFDFAGDGWTSETWTITDFSGNETFSTAMTLPDQETVEIPLGGSTCNPGGCPNGTSPYPFTVTAGSNPSQVSWYVSLGNAVVGGGQAPYNGDLCLNDGCYYIHLFDSGNNGWQGATYTLYDPLGQVLYTGTLNSGASGVVLLNIGGLDCSGTNPGGGGSCGSSQPSTECFNASCVCDTYSFLVSPTGFGNIDEIPPPGSISNPAFDGFANIAPWGGTDYGCLLAGELNSNWMMFTVATSGTLEFSFGAGGQQIGFYDWAMWPYNGAVACAGISGDILPPARCLWNAAPFGGTGLATVIPPGGQPGNYGPPLNVLAGQQYIICLSNWSYVNALVTLDFFGTATIQCSLVTPIELTRFTGEARENEIRLFWRTESEVQNEAFIIERSEDGILFEAVGTVDGNGTSASPHDYIFTDSQPMKGLNYYRLLQRDQSGQINNSRMVIAIRWTAASAYIQYHESSRYYDLHIPGIQEMPHELIITNSLNEEVMRTEWSGEQIDLPTHFPRGFYVVRYRYKTSDTDFSTLKWMNQ